MVYFGALQDPVGDAAHKVTLSMSHAGEGGTVVDKYLEGHTTLPAGGAGYKSLLVLDGAAEAYIHVTAIKVCVCERERQSKRCAMPVGYVRSHGHLWFPSKCLLQGCAGPLLCLMCGVFSTLLNG